MSSNNFKVISQSGKELTNTEHPLHPGYIIEMEIDARNLKKQDVAKELGILPGHLSELIKEKRNVSATLAIKLEEVFGIDAEYWLRVQSAFDLIKARLRILSNDEKSLIFKRSDQLIAGYDRLIFSLDWHSSSFFLQTPNSKFTFVNSPFRNCSILYLFCHFCRLNCSNLFCISF